MFRGITEILTDMLKSTQTLELDLDHNYRMKMQAVQYKKLKYILGCFCEIYGGYFVMG